MVVSKMICKNGEKKRCLDHITVTGFVAQI